MNSHVPPEWKRSRGRPRLRWTELRKDMGMPLATAWNC